MTKKFKYEVIIPPDEYRMHYEYKCPYWFRATMKAQDSWCEKNGIKDWDFDDEGMAFSAIFKNIEDAMAFKLRWG